jgi:methylenetetrahydrofolate dehydrogenase (NADP+) / methenyltetrahydrofolate cyclohydrolase
MEINGKKIADFIGTLIKKDLKKKKHKPRLTTLLVGDSPEQKSFIRIKSQVAKKLGIKFEFVHIKTTPSFEKLVNTIKEISQKGLSEGIVIQQPLPAQLSTDSIFDYIAGSQEIEGHQRKTPYVPPIGLAVLTILKYIFGKHKIDKDILVNIAKDHLFFKKILRNKKVVLVGRGITGGKPIGHTMTEAKINYIAINSKTPDPQIYLKEADIIITAVGKKIINRDNIKPGVILINVGLYHENGKLKGDYDENEIKSIASFYTPTPGGVGPIDVMYLYKNLVDATKLKKI